MVVRKFFRWADGREKNVRNPVEGLRIKPARQRGNETKKRYPFTAAELQKLFNGSMFPGCKSLHSWKIAGEFVPRQSAQFLVPLIGLFTGMRLGEIIQLRVADVKTTDGIVYFDVSSTLNEDDGAGETFKEPVLSCTKLTSKPASQMPLRKSAGKKPSTVRDRFGLDEQSITEPRLPKQHWVSCL